MLFFRSEEMIDAWCSSKNIPKRPVVSIPQLWDMATSWYGTRLDPTSRRPGPDEIRAIFHRIGLRDPFWDPQADSFG